MTQMLFIREQVFGLKQAPFAKAVGVAQSTVSRWDKGAAPSLPDLQAVRDAAQKRGLKWDDAWFFDDPPTTPKARATT